MVGGLMGGGKGKEIREIAVPIFHFWLCSLFF